MSPAVQGLCKNIGVSNFGIGHLEQLLKHAKVTPAVNQIELSPFLQRQELVDYCRSKGIALEVDPDALPVTSSYASSAQSCQYHHCGQSCHARTLRLTAMQQHEQRDKP